MATDTSESERVKIPRTPKGLIPQNFADPATDKLLSMTLALVEELSVTYDRVDTLERLLIEQGTLKPGQTDDFLPGDDIAEQRAKRRAGFLARVMRPIREELHNLGDIDADYAADELL